MRSVYVQTSNVLKFMNMLSGLAGRSPGEAGLGIVSGIPGEGKTSALCYAMNTLPNAVYVRASVTWTVTTMLQTMCKELRISPSGRRHAMLEGCIEAMRINEAVLFVDEADYLVRPSRQHTDMLDALRDIYDLSRLPVVLIGEELSTRVQATGQFARHHRRVREWVEFSGLTLLDAQRVAGEVAEVQIEGALMPGDRPGTVKPAGTLVERLYQESTAPGRNAYKGMHIDTFCKRIVAVEEFAQRNGLGCVTLSAWQSRGAQVPLGRAGGM